MSINIEPSEANVPAAGGVSTHVFTNPGDQRLVFKVKSTNNDDYRVKPVFGFLEPQASTDFQITRTRGPAKNDKFVVQLAAASADDKDPTNAFKAASSPLGEVNLPINALVDQLTTASAQPE